MREEDNVAYALSKYPLTHTGIEGSWNLIFLLLLYHWVRIGYSLILVDDTIIIQADLYIRQ